MSQPIYGSPTPDPTPGPPSRPPSGPVSERPRVSRARVAVRVAAVVAVVAVLYGVAHTITVITSRDPLAGRGQPLAADPSVPVPTPSWKPPNMLTDPAPELEIRHELEEWTLASAGVAASVKSRCDVPSGWSGATAESFSCTVTYRKLPVEYAVSTKPSSGLTFSWDATAARTVVTRRGLQAAVAKGYVGTRTVRFSNLRCDDLPDVALVPTGKALPQHCYVRIEGQTKTAWIDLVPTRNETRVDTRLQ